jgi:serine/threonine protein kinase
MSLRLRTTTSLAPGAACRFAEYDVALCADQLMARARAALGDLLPPRGADSPRMSLFLAVAAADLRAPPADSFLDPPARTHVVHYLSRADSLRSAGATAGMALCVLAEADYPSFLITPSVRRVLRPADAFQAGARLGHGAFGDVCRVTDAATGKCYARKEIPNYDRDAGFLPSGRELFARETSTQCNARHRALLSLRAVSLDYEADRPTAYLYTDFCARGALSSSMKGGLSATQKMVIAVGVALAMQYLHAHEIIHRDLKPDNVMLDDQFRPLVADFGFAKYINPGRSGSRTMDVGTPGYMAPEMLDSVDGASGYDLSVDCFSYAMLLFVLLTGKTPAAGFSLRGEMMIHQKIVNGERPPFPVDLGIPQRLVELVTRLWDQKPSGRPNFTAVCDALINNPKFWLPGTNEGELRAYVEWVTTDAFVIVVDEKRYERRLDLRFTGLDVKNFLSREFGRIVQLRNASGIVDDALKVENFPPGEITIVRDNPGERLSDVKGRCAVLHGIPPEFILIWQDGREVYDSRISGPFEVKICVPVQDIPVIVDAGAKASQVYIELETRHGVAPPFRLLSAGREVDAKESLNGLAFPLDLVTGVVIRTFRRLNSPDLIPLTFIGIPTAEVAIRKLSEELGIAPESICLTANGNIIQRTEPLEVEGDQVITFHLRAPNTICIDLNTRFFTIRIECYPRDTFSDFRTRVADSCDIDSAKITFSSGGRPVHDHECPCDYHSREVRIDAEFDIPLYTFLTSNDRCTFQMLPVTRIGEIRGSGCPRYPDIRREILRFRQFGSDLPDERTFRELDPREPIEIDLPKREFRVRTRQNTLALSHPCGFFVNDLRRFLSQKWRLPIGSFALLDDTTNVVLTERRWVDDLPEFLALSEEESVIIIVDGDPVQYRLREGPTAGAAKRALGLDSLSVLPHGELMDREDLARFVEVDLEGRRNPRFAFAVRVSSLSYGLSVHPLHGTTASKVAAIMGATFLNANISQFFLQHLGRQCSPSDCINAGEEYEIEFRQPRVQVQFQWNHKIHLMEVNQIDPVSTVAEFVGKALRVTVHGFWCLGELLHWEKPLCFYRISREKTVDIRGIARPADVVERVSVDPSLRDCAFLLPNKKVLRMQFHETDTFLVVEKAIQARLRRDQVELHIYGSAIDSDITVQEISECFEGEPQVEIVW